MTAEQLTSSIREDIKRKQAEIDTFNRAVGRYKEFWQTRIEKEGKRISSVELRVYYEDNTHYSTYYTIPLDHATDILSAAEEMWQTQMIEAAEKLGLNLTRKDIESLRAKDQTQKED